MTPDEERELVADFQAGDLRIVPALLRGFERLVRDIVVQFVTPRCELDDLLQIGRIALLKAAKKHDVTRGRLATYAFTTILGAASRHAKKQRFAVPGSDAAVARGREFTVPVSIDAPLASGIGTVGDRIAAPEVVSVPEDEASALLATLTAKEREIVERHWADTPETLEQIGASLGVSKERVRQIEKRAFGRMRRAATRRPVRIERT